MFNANILLFLKKFPPKNIDKKTLSNPFYMLKPPNQRHRVP